MLGIGLGTMVAAGFDPRALVHAATTERIVVDRHTGLALFGFDPVAYFTDAQPLMGRVGLEYWFAGATWRFRNEGNQAAFTDHPGIYMPRFGGYDPMALARGVAKPGHPHVWLVFGGRLYLFDRAEARAAFAANPDKAIAAADTKWPAVLKTLVP